MKKAIIVGAGIGGLTTALCLHKIGWNVVLLEQAKHINEIGAGVQISPNATKILANLGLAGVLSRHACQPTSIEMRWGHDGSPIFSIPLMDVAIQRWGAGYFHLHRTDFINLLKEAIEIRLPHALHLDSRVSAYKQYKTHISAILTNGNTLDADLLIGADGIHSQIRQQMFPQDTKKFTGYIAWRMTIPNTYLNNDQLPNSACIWAGSHRHAVTYPLRNNKLVNFVGIVARKNWLEESWSAVSTRQQALNDYKNWHPTIQSIIEQANSHYCWALLKRKLLTHWHDGCCLLLGDACHPTLPSSAQGAAMAIEDAWILAKNLDNDISIHNALATYTKNRYTRIKKVQYQANKNMTAFHYPSKLVYLPVQIIHKLYPNLLIGRQDWLYGYNA